MTMTLDEVRTGRYYECLVSNKKVPVYVRDLLPSGVLGTSWFTKREVFIKKEDVPRRVFSEIADVHKWYEREP